VAPVPLRLPDLERALVETPLADVEQARSLAHRWGARAHPLRDNEWKVDAAAGVLAQAIAEAMQPTAD
jgi:CO/xanthine dehydrogenase FAD-binding subunit